ncbi:MAG: hypothetical protein SXG53_24115, partial [Pseudomonadota bacterium]|nr:hypothetical protein [Pseudomonadota bacterium]
GIESLKRAMRLDTGAQQSASRLIVQYLRRHGRNEEALTHIVDSSHGMPCIALQPQPTRA